METKIFYAVLILGCLSLFFRWLIKEPKETKKKRIHQEIREWLDTLLMAVILAFFIMTFIIQAFKIPSSSMYKTLQIKDHLFVVKFIYGTKIPFTDKHIWPIREPQRRDIIVFKYPLEPKKDFIKRCIGLPGETIEIKDKVVYINGGKQDEPYTIYTDPYSVYPKDAPYLTEQQRNRDNFGPLKIPEKHYFMMGDNRDRSLDSRFWGPLNRKYIKGKALFVYWPPKRIKIIK